MVGMGEAYIAAFALALGLGEIAAGLVVTLPLLAGGVLQLVTPAGVRWLRSARRWTVLCAGLQAASLVPFALGALAGRLPAWTVYAAATLYWAAGMAATPSWNLWVERSCRAGAPALFARRTGLVTRRAGEPWSARRCSGAKGRAARSPASSSSPSRPWVARLTRMLARRERDTGRPRARGLARCSAIRTGPAAACSSTCSPSRRA
jgi:hypothetical protein